MTLAGLSLAQVLGVLSAAGAVVVGLYLLKLRRRAVAVPFAPLWKRVVDEQDATSLFSRLKRILSLVLQLALLALLAFALGDPRATSAWVEGRNVVVLIDASASMQAVDGSPTRLDDAKGKAKALVAGMGGADRAIVAQMDALVTPLSPMSGDSAQLERAIDAVRPTETRADFPRALRFAVDALRGLEHGEIVVISDGALGEAKDAAGAVHLGDVTLSFQPVGTRDDNAAITAFSVRRYPLDKGRYEVMIEVANSGREPAELELSLLGDGQLVDVSKLRLAPGERLPRFYPNLSGASRTLEAVIRAAKGGADALPADDHAYALLPERKRTRVLAVSPGNMYLEAALLLDEYLDVTWIKPSDYASAVARSDKAYDVLVFDGVSPQALPRTAAIYIDPRATPGTPVGVDKELRAPGFDKIARKHPLVRFLALDEVNVAEGHKLVPGDGDTVVGASSEGPLLVTGERAGVKFVALGFDVRKSDLALRVAWPVFLMNCINYFADEDARFVSSLRTGEAWRVAVGASVASATLTAPSGEASSVPIHEGRAVMRGARAGFYSLALDGAEGPPIALAANLLDADESRVEPRAALDVDGKRASAPQGFGASVKREIWIYLALLVVLLTAIEWATYHRRVTV